jgi:hypothetical protein
MSGDICARMDAWKKATEEPEHTQETLMAEDSGRVTFPEKKKEE